MVKITFVKATLAFCAGAATLDSISVSIVAGGGQFSSIPNAEVIKSDVITHLTFELTGQEDPSHTGLDCYTAEEIGANLKAN